MPRLVLTTTINHKLKLKLQQTKQTPQIFGWRLAVGCWLCCVLCVVCCVLCVVFCVCGCSKMDDWRLDRLYSMEYGVWRPKEKCKHRIDPYSAKD